MEKTLTKIYNLEDGKDVHLRILIGNAGDALTTVFMNGTAVVSEQRGHVEMDLGSTENVRGTKILCYTHVRSIIGDKTRVDYMISGGVEALNVHHVEDEPMDPEADDYHATFFLL